MGLISNKYKYIFIHIPKTGGQTIKNTFDYDISFKGPPLSSFLFKSNIKNMYHFTYDDLEQYNNKYNIIENFNDYYKFTFVRNPYDRLYSAYLYLKKEIPERVKKVFPKLLSVFIISSVLQSSRMS